MKKIMIAFTAVFFGLVSCKKDPPPPPAPSVITLEKDNSFSPGILSTPQTGWFQINQFKGNATKEMPGYLYIGFDYNFDINRITYQRVVVYTSPTDSVVMTDPSVGDAEWPAAPDVIMFDGPIIIKTYVRTSSSVQIFGELTSFAALYYYDGDTEKETGEIQGQTVKFGYPISPIIKSEAPPTDLIENGVERILGIVSVEAPTNGDIATKQIAWRHSFADNGESDTLRYDSLQVYRDGPNGMENITSIMTIMDSLGNVINHLSELELTHRKMYTTVTAGSGEFTTTRGTKDRIIITGVPSGFGPTIDGDGSQAIPVISGPAMQSSHQYLNKGTSFGSIVKLYSSPVATSAANGFVQNYVWSPKTANPFSGIFGISSNGWFNSNGLQTDIFSTILHTRGAERSIRLRIASAIKEE